MKAFEQLQEIITVENEWLLSFINLPLCFEALKETNHYSRTFWIIQFEYNKFI